ncbi:DUF4349 domain-containing protein [Paenibacillus sp. SYP-B3998]|uniref:DUF4349 domain-containing protein n=1 Tax=Paenibacillus sp. SYP-B3998 TaxID=2678564 RepID=A0A6G3ZU80_9BACL|nr:DUF4349 domain-containing protein [Paenibacillus sp. SYP-B3998]NEW05264.1 DUF4349 domain-containing protein [Paenibacillus sp. SYP-B3998]
MNQNMETGMGEMGESQRGRCTDKAQNDRLSSSGKRRREPYKRTLMIALSISLLCIWGLTGCSSSRADSTHSAASEAKASSQLSGNASTEKLSGVTQPKGMASSDTERTVATAASDQEKQKAVVSSTTLDIAAPITLVPKAGSDETAGFNRKLIYKANLVMPVEDYSKAQTRLRDLVALSGAYILQFSENTNTGERGGTFTIKVAANGFASLLDGLESISPSLQRNVQGQDVTEEYVDLDSRLKAKQLVEGRLLSFMDKATKTDDLLAFSGELSKVQGEIEQIKGRMRYLDQNVSYSTIELRMYQQTGNKPLLSDPNKLTLQERIQRAWNSSLNVLTTVLQGILVFLAAAVPVLVIVGIIALPIWLFKRKRNKQLLEIRNQLSKQNASFHSLEDEQDRSKEGQ